MTPKKLLLILTAATSMAIGTAYGQESDAAAAPPETKPQEQRPDRRNMTDEQRAAARERRQNMTDEERQAMRDRKRERWQNMSAEERQAKREKMRARRGGEDGQHRRGKRGGQRPDSGRPPRATPDAV